MKKKFVALLVAVPVLLTGAIVAPAVASNVPQPEAAVVDAPTRVLPEGDDPDWDGVSSTTENRQGSDANTANTWPVSTDHVGADRYVTNILTSQYLNNVNGPVFLVTALNYPDALAAGPAASLTYGTVITTDSANLPANVRAEIVRLNPPQVYIIGGTTSVSDNVRNQVAAAVPRATIERFAAVDRYQTSSMIADRFFPGQRPRVGFADGNNYQEGFALSAIASRPGAQFPILLGWSGAIPTDVGTSLGRMRPSEIILVGDAIPASFEPTMRAQSGGTTHIRRVTGSNYEQMSVNLHTATMTNGADVYPFILSTGANYPDALSASNIASRTGASLLLTTNASCLPASMYNLVQTQGINYRHRVGGGTNVASWNTQC